ncbi:TetR/AcrR family transcriptional regulator [Nocardia jejuensis]|uniref:TetR/AcrR family transcriptional regulator n=1 Tax=Nocardia jejuensis TaxID=328049 RepID=UPI00082F8A7C|nr:TetR/AcrR family transcriptional regulator [Nocardia jejuensis]
MSSVPVPATFTTVHPLSDSQRERRERLIGAARELAAEGGYAAVTMHAVADRATLARATVYRYFGSKDQLLTAVGAEWAREVTAAHHDIGAAGRSADAKGPAERVAGVLAAIIERTAAELPLCTAVVTAVISGDRTADAERSGLYALWMGQFDEFIGDAVPSEERAEIDYLLGQLLLAGFTSMCMLAQPKDHVRDMLTGAARRLLP